MTGIDVSQICRSHSKMVSFFANVLSDYGNSLFPFPVVKVNIFLQSLDFLTADAQDLGFNCTDLPHGSHVIAI